MTTEVKFSALSQDVLDGGLIHAADYGSLEEAVELMKAGADPNGYPLIMAIQARHPEVVEAMLSFGADPNRVYIGRDARSVAVTPLVHAIQCRQPKMVRMLLDAGADPNSSGGSGRSPQEALDTILPSMPDYGVKQEIVAMLAVHNNALERPNEN